MVPIKDYGWIAGCTPTSPTWKDPVNFTFNVSWPAPPLSAPNTVNFNHKKAMDPSLHPHLHEHGQFLSFRKGPVPSHPPSPTLKPQCITISLLRIWPAGWASSDMKRPSYGRRRRPMISYTFSPSFLPLLLRLSPVDVAHVHYGFFLLLQ